MAQIMLEDIRKQFKVYERPEGKWGMLRGAFTRHVRRVDALRDIGFSIGEGELVGYIGPNGAGKSTTVKVMSGILTPDAGTCRVCGLVPWKERVRHVSQIGVVFGQRSQLWWDVPVADTFDLLQDIYAVPPAQYRARRNVLVEALEIGPLLKTPVRQLSLGQRMRCELAAALLHSPKILFLDEPTIGLDAVSKLALRAFLKEENRRSGVTVLLTTHDMDDIEALCTRVMVIGRGALLYDGQLEALKARYLPGVCVRIAFEGEAPSVAEVLGVPGILRAQAALQGAQEQQAIEAYFDPAQVPRHRMTAALAGRFRVRDITVVERDINEVIAAMYRDMDLA